MKKALLVIDVQNEYFTGKLPVTYPVGSLDNILLAIRAASNLDIPIILIHHMYMPDSDWQNHPDNLENLMPWSKAVQAECKR